MAEACRDIEPEERYVAVTFPEYVWEYLEKESEDTGVPVNIIIRDIVTGYVQAEKGSHCG